MVQPTPKNLSRDEKEEIVEHLKHDIEDYPVIGVLDMQNLPSKQLQQIKKEMKEFASVRMTRKTLISMAIEDARKDGISQLEENEAVQPALIFSNKGPFQLYSLIKSNKTSAAAQGGEEAPSDIEIPDGDTGIGPGPMLGKLQGAGLQVQVQDGSIHVQEPGVIVEVGDTITPDDAEILNQVGIEPLEIGLDLDIAYSDGEVFTAEQLNIDEKQYRDDVEKAVSGAFNLAVNAGILNETTAGTIVSEAARKAKNLSVSEGIPTEVTIKEILAHASSKAKGVNSRVDLDSVEVETGDEENSEQPENEERENQGDEGSNGETEGDGIDYDKIMDQSMDDAKEDIQELENPDFDAMTEAEERNKQRKTMLQWLEGKQD